MQFKLLLKREEIVLLVWRLFFTFVLDPLGWGLLNINKLLRRRLHIRRFKMNPTLNRLHLRMFFSRRNKNLSCIPWSPTNLLFTILTSVFPFLIIISIWRICNNNRRWINSKFLFLQFKYFLFMFSYPIILPQPIISRPFLPHHLNRNISIIIIHILIFRSSIRHHNLLTSKLWTLSRLWWKGRIT